MRIPAGFCGTFSLKPTPERLSYRDCANTVISLITYSMKMFTETNRVSRHRDNTRVAQPLE